MSYDYLNRLVNTTKQIQNSLVNSNSLTSPITISVLQYDVLGQLKIKNLGNTKSGNYYTGYPLETLNYDYNIRGWLLGINRAFVRDLSTANSSYSSGETFTTPPSYNAGNYFGFELGYDKSPTVGGSSWAGTIQFNGNITGTIWKSVHDGQIRKYDFSYDAVNRLMAADFNQYTGTSFNKNAGLNFSANNLSYDANGNILFMNQYGLPSTSATSSIPIDLLNYNYISGTNRLQSVSDYANGNTPAPGTPNYLGDFHYNSGGSAATYSYDANGNLTSDGNKNISYISYNFLNLPQTIWVSGKGTISYIYDAAGNKLQKTTVDNTNSTTTVTSYLGGIVFQNDALQFVSHEEGRVRSNSTNSGYIFDYYLKDHLGNTRMTITDDNTASNPVIDATSYYPFGLTMANISNKSTGKLENKFKYNGKEQQNNEFGDGSGLEIYDYGARLYNHQIGRFQSVDPDAISYYDWNPYTYVRDNPILRIDPTGKWDVTIHVSRNREKYGYGIAVITDRKGNEVFKFNVRAQGVGGSDRMIANSNTPLGIYDIPDVRNEAWIKGGSRLSYGPNYRLVMSPESGEILESGRDLIRMHGGRQEKMNEQTGEWEPIKNATLKKTHGCLRCFESDIKEFKSITDELERNDKQEFGGKVTIVDDLIENDNSSSVTVTKANGRKASNNEIDKLFKHMLETFDSYFEWVKNKQKN